MTRSASALVVALILLTTSCLMARQGSGGGPTAPTVDEGALRDIWYVVPDRYPRADTLAEVFGFDNSEFLDGLEQRGFQVADASLANYPKTAHSLVATWSMAPLDELFPEPRPHSEDWQPLYRMLRDAELARVLVAAGYEYVHLGSWWSPTSVSDRAHENLLPPPGVPTVEGGVPRLVAGASGVRAAASPPIDRTEDVIGGAAGPMLGDRPLSSQNFVFGNFQLDQLDRLARTPASRPRFVLAHLLLPHQPFVFEADGSLVTQAETFTRSRAENVGNHVAFLNERLLALVTTLTSGPPEDWPVIVIQSDEGPHPVARTGPSYDWSTAPSEVLEEKLRTLSAILLPQSTVVLPEDLTGVDTWRLVLDATIGTDYGPVDDVPVAVFPGDDQPYVWIDVGDRVDQG